MQKSLVIVITCILGITLVYNMVIYVLYMLSLLQIDMQTLAAISFVVTLQSFLVATFLLKNFCKEEK